MKLKPSVYNSSFTISHMTIPVYLSIVLVKFECVVRSHLPAQYNDYYFLPTAILLQFEYEEVDISLDENAFWRSRYKYEIPVVHLNGKMLMKHWFDEDKMKSALDGLDKV